MTRAFFISLLSVALFHMQGQTRKPNRPFPVFDATGFTQKPDLTQYGLRPITVVYPAFMWDSSSASEQAQLPDQHRVSAFAQLANQSTGILVIDIEQWPLTGDPTVVAESIKKYQAVIKWFKAPTPELKVGLYGVLPIRDYWDSIPGKDSSRYAAWQKRNDIMAPIAHSIDVLFPSIYTFYEDRSGWQKYAIAQIEEARRVAPGKPVYVFLWPQYHGSDKKLGDTFMPGDYWRMELDTAREHADGVVIWCCSTKQVWNDRAPWWLETQDFIKTNASTTK